MRSGRLYSLITMHWLKVAPVLVVGFGALEFVVGGMTADSRLEYYVFTWASVTSGLWFLFDRVEQTASDQARQSAAAWINSSNVMAAVESLPTRFAAIFDLVFGERHLSWRCFRRSAIASFVAVVAVSLFFFSRSSLEPSLWSSPPVAAVVMLFIAPLVWNVVPDYLSLMETRYLLGLLDASSTTVRVVVLLLIDVLATAAFGVLGYLAFSVVSALPNPNPLYWPWFVEIITHFDELLLGMLRLGPVIEIESITIKAPLGIYFYSTFFTSAWLWVYVLSALVSRILVRLGGGIGLLLRVTDVEHQPFRSLGFTSIILVSIMFLVGLPFVLL